MELDYVKTHLFNSKGALNNSMWKLLDMTPETSDHVDASEKSVSFNLVLEETPQPCAQTGVQTKSPVKQFTETKTLKALLLNNGKDLPISLFGRARFTLQDSGFSIGGCNTLPVNVLCQTVSNDARQEFLQDAEVKERSPEKRMIYIEWRRISNLRFRRTRVHESAFYLNIGSSGLSGSVRKLYRSMNVPVPQPLPSLRDLINSRKRAKRGIKY